MGRRFCVCATAGQAWRLTTLAASLFGLPAAVNLYQTSFRRADGRLPTGSRWRQRMLAGLLAVAAAGAQAQTAASAPAGAASGPTLSATVGKPLQAAQDALKAGHFKDALARLAEAEAMPSLTPYERYIILRLKAPAVFGVGELATAVALFASVIEAPLLFEQGLENWFDFTVCVATSSANQLARLIERGIPQSLAEQRISKQLPLAQKLEKADFVISNDGTPEALRMQVNHLVNRLSGAR